MTTSVERGLPNRGSVLDLLNEAYGDWGNEAYFEWKYNQYPQYDQEGHCFYIEQDELVAFRRMFQKNLLVDNDRAPVYVFGDTAVSTDYQGEGMYSKLLNETTDIAASNGADAVITYNNIDNITYKTKKDRGWKHSVLPLYIRVLSDEKVLASYASKVLSDESALTDVMEVFGDRLVICTPNDQFVLSELLNKRVSHKRRVPVGIEMIAVAQLIEAVSNAGFKRVVTTGLKSMIDGDIVPFRRASSQQVPETHNAVVRRSADEVSDNIVDEMVELYQLVRAGRCSFSREKHDVQHLLSYPDATALLYLDDDNLVGFAVVGPYKNGEVIEARVLDLVAPSGTVYRELVDSIIDFSSKEGHDLIVLLSERDPGDEWANVHRQVIMWDYLEDKHGNFQSPSVSMYDVL